MTECVVCGVDMPEGYGMVCPLCKERCGEPTQLGERYTCVARSVGRSQGKQQATLQAALDRIEELETFLFAFVWNRATYPLGQQLGKTEAEIADKTWETVIAASAMVNYAKMNELRISAKRQCQKQKGAVHRGEGETEKSDESHRQIF